MTLKNLTSCKDTIAHLAPYFMSRIKILNQPTSKRHGNSKPIEYLKVGDRVVDKNRVLKSGLYVGALCRIAKLAPGNRVALVVHLKKGMKNNPDFLRTGKQGVFCKQNHSQPCGTCNHTQTPTQSPLEVPAVETTQVYFVARGPKSEDKTVPQPDQVAGHLSGPQVPQGDKRYLLPDPAFIETPSYGTNIPFIDSQDPSLLTYAELDPNAWLEASSNAPDAPPLASEKESKAGLPTAASGGE